METLMRLEKVSYSYYDKISALSDVILEVNDGDHVAIVDSDFPYYWAWLADARVTLQISFDGNYARRQAEWTKAAGILWSQNASFLVSPALDGVTDQPGWRRLGTSNVFAYPAHPSRAY